MTMGMSISMMPRMELHFLKSIFPQVETLLEDREYQKALRFVAWRKNMDRYTDTIDFLFCELFGHPWIKRCQEYYHNDGDPLRKIITEEQKEYYQKKMLSALELAYQRFTEHRKCSWNWFRLSALAA